MRRNAPVPHGYAVAWGCVVELILSHMSVGFPSEQLQRFADYVYENYGAYPLTCNDYPELLELMHHDKKNTSSEINFTLLKNVGEVLIDCTCSEEDIKTAMDIFRDYMHI
jgi:3-dehydroquinate synthase